MTKQKDLNQYSKRFKAVLEQQNISPEKLLLSGLTQAEFDELTGGFFTKLNLPLRINNRIPEEVFDTIPIFRAASLILEWIRDEKSIMDRNYPDFNFSIEFISLLNTINPFLDLIDEADKLQDVNNHFAGVVFLTLSDANLFITKKEGFALTFKGKIALKHKATLFRELLQAYCVDYDSSFTYEEVDKETDNEVRDNFAFILYLVALLGDDKQSFSCYAYHYETAMIYQNEDTIKPLKRSLNNIIDLIAFYYGLQFSKLFNLISTSVNKSSRDSDDEVLIFKSPIFDKVFSVDKSHFDFFHSIK